jgi:tricorn protease
VKVGVGDVIRTIDGVSTLSVANPSMLLRNKAGRQVLLGVLSKGATDPHDVIVKPLSADADTSLRYRSWEVSRRQRVEDAGHGDIGYVHLRAMGTGDIGDFTRDFYPVFNRKALIIDVRHNNGGNIDSWVLERLMRKAWMYWNQPAGRPPSWNMQYAFRGHMVVLCDERTASDGEAFSEGFKRLGLGKVIGTRTWGGEIWLSSGNTTVDGGLTSAGENGVFDAQGVWLIEGHGVEPDITVDNLPYATFNGQDAQLQSAVTHLQELIRTDPRDIPPVPPTPVKAVK